MLSLKPKLTHSPARLIKREYLYKHLLSLLPSILLALTLALAIHLLFLSLARAVNITVTTTQDQFGGGPNECSLREAIQAANTDTPVYGCPAGSGLDTIILPTGTYTITRTNANEDDNRRGDLDISADLIISGADAATTIINGNTLDRVFHTTNGVSLTLINLTVKNGNVTDSGGGIFARGDLTLTNVNVLSSTAGVGGGGVQVNGIATLSGGRFENNRAANDGGGLFANNTLSLSGTQFISNTATNGGGVRANNAVTLSGGRFENNTASNNGGGLFANTTLTLSGTQFISNTANTGGGVYANSTAILNEGYFENNRASTLNGGGLNSGSTLILTGTQFIGNTAQQNGGGVSVNGGVTLNGGRFENNRANNGGGLFANNVLTLTDTLFMNNTANSGGGARVNNAATLNGGRFENNQAATSNGGGLYVGGALVLTGTQLISNTAAQGGGVFHTSGAARVINALFARNAATSNGEALNLRSLSETQILHATIASPTQVNGAAIYVANGTVNITNTIIVSHTTGIQRAGGTVNQNYNLFWGNANNTTGTVGGGTGSITGNPAFTDPTTDDYHLTAASVAIDRGVNTGIATDFEGQARPLGNSFDLGYDEMPPIVEIAVLGNGQVIADGDASPSTADHTDFGDVLVANGAVIHTFTISNTGLSDLNLTGLPPITITGPAASDFSLIVGPTTPVDPNGTTTFQLRFDPTAVGTRTATITIANDDTDENPYDFVVQGVGIVPLIQFDQAVPYNDNEDAGVSNVVTLRRSDDTSFTSTVQVTITGGSAGDGSDYDNSGFPLIINFDPGVVIQTISVPIIDDAMDENIEDITFQVSSLSNAVIGTQYTATLEIVDNDSAGITVSPTSLTVSEPNNSAIFNIRLTSEPTATVTINLSSDDLTECVVPASASLTSLNWQTGVTITVTAVDDLIFDGPQNCIIHSTVSSSDANYNGQTVVEVSVSVNDNDIPGITVASSTGLTTTEAGGTAAFGMVLNTEPTAPVTVTLASADLTEGIANPTSLTFTPLNWNSPQTVTITGVNDDVDDGDTPYTVIINPAISNDSTYNNLNPDDVNLTNLDDDTAGFMVSTISGDTHESGATATFNIRLTSQPLADVTIPVVSSDSTEGTASPANLIFTPLNWHTLQTITVTGVDDLDSDGNIAYTIQTNPTTSSTDPLYHHQTPVNVAVVNHDNEALAPTTQSLYLPIIFSRSVAGFDLVVDNLNVGGDGVSVTIKNIGNTPVVDAFWVDVYLNPATPPTHVNQRWNDVGTQGLVWGVIGAALPLDPDETLTLTINDTYYSARRSHFTTPLIIGSRIYAQVDSVNLLTNYGGVRESHEINHEPYNNIYQTVAEVEVDPVTAGVEVLQANTSNLPSR
ncbi:MAG: choice-of-anchor D domain-containing protein [Anaerolineae bacterium]|nr:choice-of-anchor D domain-containing protein [Anaerolineae bacterium]